jgi:hypothetical protein
MEYKIFLPSIEGARVGQKFIFIPVVNGIEDDRGEQNFSFSELTPQLANLVLRCIGETPKYIRTRL